MKLASRLVSWYEVYKRDLPWRHTRDPYPIWLSEVILQQTRVDQGMAYYHTFLSRFPSVHDLAGAREEEVLRCWQGLGYYSRARNLHHAARHISTELHGQFPRTYEELLKLRGVGSYTAAAIASFCFGEVRAVVDGNVIRVLGRLFALEAAPDTPAGRRQYQQLADELIRAEDPALFNQAIMEFGALQCTPGRPDCGRCPVAELCESRRLGRVEEFPARSRRTEVKHVWFYYAVPEYAGRTWVRKRSHSGIWKGLHDFPCVESDTELSHDELIAAFARDTGLQLGHADLEQPETRTHILSHRKIHAAFFRITRKIMWKNRPSAFREVDWEALGEIGIPRLIDRYVHG
jgi:A/G-specific adenine glycosylase